jgi:hypothetical protein
MKQQGELRMSVYVGHGVYLYPALPKDEWVQLIPKFRPFDKAPFCHYIERRIERHLLCVRAVLARGTRIFLRHIEMNTEWNTFRHL